MAIVVLDVGKSNAKLILLDDKGATLTSLSRPCQTRPGPPFPHLDLDGIWDWAVAGLRRLAAEAAIAAIVPLAHGAGAVLIAGDEPALPALDYEFDGPDERALAFARTVDPFETTGTPLLPGGLTVAAQLDWLEARFPDAFARTTAILPLPQYWAWRLSDVAACEVTSLGSHSHLWRPYERDFSGLVDRRGWRRRFPPLRSAWEALGPIRPELGTTTGLPAACRVLCGIHDSNATYLPHRLAREDAFTAVSTGTWVIAMAGGGAGPALDPHADMIVNVDATGRPVPTARWMGGRDLALMAGADALATQASEHDVADLVGRRVMPLPTFIAGSGPFPRGEGRIAGGLPEGDGARAALAALYGALMVDDMLGRLDAGGPTIVEGSFARNRAFLGLLAAFRPGQPVHATPDPSGTARGAWLLAHWPASEAESEPLPPAVAPWRIDGLDAYRASWRNAAARPLG